MGEWRSSQRSSTPVSSFSLWLLACSDGGDHRSHSSSSMTMGWPHVPSRGTVDSRTSVGLNRDPLGGAGESSTREGNILDLLIGVGEECTIVRFCLVPNRDCWMKATAARASPKWLCGSGVDGPTRRFAASSWSTIGLIGPAANRFCLTWGSGNLPNDGGVSESTTMGPIGDAIVPGSAEREGAACVTSIRRITSSSTAQFLALVAVPLRLEDDECPLSSF